MRKLFLILFLLCPAFLWSMPEKPTAPAKMNYAGMELELSAGARSKVQEVIDRLYKSPEYFQTLLDRCDTYMPFVEDAFDLVGIPSDLKYICILESALIGDAVSRSNAVGFWQFKEFTAKEVGLIVSDQVDERKHIFRSSLGAARYFHRLNRDFDNWLYSVIGYNQGPSGALKHTRAKYYGKTRMPVDFDLHPYAVKALAYKLAFEQVVGKNKEPKLWLETRPTAGETSVSTLAKLAEIEVDELREFNLWMRKNSLPARTPFTYYIPHRREPLIAELSEPLEAISKKEVPVDKEPEPEPPKKKVENPSRVRNTFNRFTERSVFEDPDYGKEFVVVRENELLVEIATRNKVKLKKLADWNGITQFHGLKEGKVLHLRKQKKARYHIVQPGETLTRIANMYGIYPDKIRKKNRMSRSSDRIFAGQKLYLRKKKPAREKVILLELPGMEKPVLPEFQPKEKTGSSSGKAPKEVVAEPADPPISFTPKEKTVKGYETNWVWHTVERGETLWGLYKKYNCPVEIIRKLNNLPSNEIMPGQKLKIMQRIEKDLPAGK